MSKIIMPILIFTFNLQATNVCTDPFANQRSQFSLTEPLSCNPAQPVYQLQISQNVYLQPTCIGNNKVIDLYLDNGDVIHSFSTEQIGQSGWSVLTVESACTGKNLFTITPDYQVPGIGTVDPTENTANTLILRDNQTRVIANATKHFVASGNCGQAIWNVENNPAISPLIIAYLLALKDNSLFSCSSTTPQKNPVSNGLSAGAITGIAASIAVAMTGAVLTVRWLFQHHPKWFKLPTSEV
ncbi:MAG: hypothetical protein WCK49_03780 [Myxococcaceae bacterium]